MISNKDIKFEFSNNKLSYSKVKKLTQLFISNKIGIKWFEDKRTDNFELSFIFKRCNYNLVFKNNPVEECFILLDGTLNVVHEEISDVLVEFLQLIDGNGKVYEKINGSFKLIKEVKNGKLLYDSENYGFSESTLHMLIDFSLAELSEAIESGNEDKIKEIEDTLRGYQEKLSHY